MKLDNNEKLKLLISNFPSNPGVYQFMDEKKEIIYIGKAKNLRKRVISYFFTEHNRNNKIKVLIKKTRDIKFILVNSESDALLLENNLIKKYQPKYNILLKDDKTFPWICIINERFPRILYTRNYVNDGSEYFGPYTSVVMIKTILALIKKLYPLRNCRLDLSENKIKQNKYKACLEYHVGNCKAPCIDAQSNYEYMSNIEQIKKIFKGRISDLQSYLQKLMKEYSYKMDFENAQIVKEKIDLIKRYNSKSTIVNARIDNVDVFGIIEKDDNIGTNYLNVKNGAIIQVYSIFVKKKLDEKLNELLSIIILEIRQKLKSDAKEIITSIMPDIVIGGIKYTVPKKGDKLKLLELSLRNVDIFLDERLKQSFEKSKKFKLIKNNVLEKLKRDLRLSKLPLIIECFDNSNLQGTNAVASCVVFRNGVPSKKDYRHFNIKTVIGPNDFASMQEVVYRRYKRILDEKSSLPDLIIIDGGIGQLNSARKSLEVLGIVDKVSVIGLAKKLEEIFCPNDPLPLYIDKNSTSLKLIQNIRNEAHRFGINFHKTKRSITVNNSILDEIENIGSRTKEKLFQKFKSVENIKNINEAELVEVVGKSKARKIKSYFSENNYNK
jgi:excinuclease ABC subunit C